MKTLKIEVIEVQRLDPQKAIRLEVSGNVSIVIGGKVSPPVRKLANRSKLRGFSNSRREGHACGHTVSPTLGRVPW